jgi:hypothetical protein
MMRATEMRAMRVWLNVSGLYSISLVGFFLAQGVASADVVVVGRPTKPSSVQSSPAVVVDDLAGSLGKRAEKKRTLRCWQNGLLILERRVVLPPEDASRTVRIGSAEEIEAQLFDLRNAICLLQ